ncbi:MAG: tetratricopeptide repeat protein [Bacteroidia bacterium]|nr:tetratricopeptide repeat protein [Bacteroidia bacterium]
MARILFLMLLFLTSAAIAQSKRSARACHEDAEEALSKKKLELALELLNECLRSDPHFTEAYYTRGMVREQLGDMDGALTDYNIYLEYKPDRAEALFSRATLRYKSGLYDLAKTDFLNLLNLPAGETTTVFFQQDLHSSSTIKIFTTQGANKAYILNYLGLVEIKLKNFPAAIVVLDSAINLSPTDADPIVNRGLAKEGNNDPPGAIADYQLALKLNPENSLARHNLGVLTATYGGSKDSEILMLESIEQNPRLPYPHAQLAYHKFNNGDYKGALAEYNRAIALDSTDLDYLVNRGIVKEKLNDYEGSLGDFTNAISLKPDFERAWFNRGNVLTKLDRLAEAVEDYTLAIFYDPNYAAAYYNRALDRDKLGLKKEACEDLLIAKKFGQVIESRVISKICQ